MNRLNIKIGSAFIIIVIAMISLTIVINANQKRIPNTILIKVLTPLGDPDLNATCNAQIISKDKIYNKNLSPIQSLSTYLNVNKTNTKEEKGYYLLETNLTSSRYKIEINCKSNVFKNEGTLILTPDDIACEINQGILIC